MRFYKIYKIGPVHITMLERRRTRNVNLDFTNYVLFSLTIILNNGIMITNEVIVSCQTDTCQIRPSGLVNYRKALNIILILIVNIIII